jgi:hypothetical protein
VRRIVYLGGVIRARSRTMIQLVLPAPITIAARSSMVSTGPARRISPVRWRLRRWRDGCPAVVVIPVS